MKSGKVKEFKIVCGNLREAAYFHNNICAEMHTHVPCKNTSN